MFLPVLLLRDLGLAGFLVFAVPNVLGAAAMGWIIHSAEQSRQIVARHLSACVWFSLITIIFHAFFAAWMIRRLAGPSSGIAVAGAFAFFWLILQWPRGGKFLAAILVLVVSLVVMGWGFHRGELPYVATAIPNSPTHLPAIDALWLGPACLFGFVLCPYLDLTFHAARQGLNPSESRFAFAQGFGFYFLIMILCTMAYSGPLVGRFDRQLFPQLALILAIYFIVHSGFVVAAHVQQLASRAHQIKIRTFALFCTLVVAAVLLGSMSRGLREHHGFTLGEIIYRCFLGFYALVFPAYVWLRMVPGQRSDLRLLMTIVILLPLYALAFVGQMTVFLVPAVALILLAKLPFTRPPVAPVAAIPPSAGEAGK